MTAIMNNCEANNAYNDIELGYLMVEKINQELSKPVETIGFMLYQMTGMDMIRRLGFVNQKISYLELIIASKKIVEADYSADEKALNELIKLEIQ